MDEKDKVVEVESDGDVLPENVKLVMLPSKGQIVEIAGYNYEVKYVDRKHGEIRVRFHGFIENNIDKINPSSE